MSAVFEGRRWRKVLRGNGLWSAYQPSIAEGALYVSAFRVLAGRTDFRRAGRGGFALGYELEVGVVEVAEVLASEGGGAAAVTVGE